LQKEQKVIATGSSPQWSPDGKSIAYIGNNKGNTAIFIYDVETDVKEFIVDIYESDYFIDHYAEKNFCWSPDGKTIAYISTEPFAANDEMPAYREFTDLLYKTKGGRGRQLNADKRHTHIWLVSIKEKITRPVFVSEYNEHSLSFSPDDRQTGQGSDINYLTGSLRYQPGFK
jgi:Tol biopolymer transport system component